MWHKAICKRHPMRLELTRVGLLVDLANHYTTRGYFVGYLTPNSFFVNNHFYFKQFSLA